MGSSSKVGWIVLCVVAVAVLLTIVASVQREETEPGNEVFSTGGAVFPERHAHHQEKQETAKATTTGVGDRETKPEEQKPASQQQAAAQSSPQESKALVVLPPPVPPPQSLVNPFSLRTRKLDPSCPYGLRYDTEMSHENVPLPHERHKVDVAAIREATSANDKSLKIPKVVVQFQGQDQIPEAMREAMQTLYDSNPEFEFKYFSDERAHEMIEQKFPDEKYKNSMKTLIPPRMRAEYAGWCYLWEFGGVVLHAGFVAGKTKLLDFLDGETDFVAAVMDNDRLSTEFVAVAPKHPVIGKVLDIVVANIQGHSYGSEPESVTGTVPFTDAFKEIAKETPRAGHKAGNIHLVSYDRKPNCFIGNIAASKKDPLFWTRYPLYGADTRWYRLRNDDADAAWGKRHVFGNWDCPGGLTLSQENDQINQNPERNRVLVDMSPYHPATKIVGDKQKIPRIIMQTNKADRVPKDLRKNMQKMIDVNPDYEYYYFSDARIRDFIKQHFDQRTLDAFDSLIPGAYKSDLFRYCFLYIKGGVFLDGDVHAVRPLQELLRHDDEFVSAEDCGIGWVHNAFMASVPGHAIVKKAIDMCVDRITRRDYGENPLAISGPILLRDAFKTVTGQGVHVGEYADHVRLVAYTRQGHCMVGKIEEHGRVVLWMRYDTYKSETRWYMAGKSYYHDLWHEHRVFK